MSTHDNENNAKLKPDVLARLAKQAQAENKTVNDLLDEAARRLLETRRDIDGLRSLISENRAQAIEEKLARQLPNAALDPAQIKQVLVNLIKNAMQAMTRGGTLKVESKLGKGSTFTLMLPMVLKK